MEKREGERSVSPLGLYGQSPDPQNEAIGTKFRHLVVNTIQTPYERSITKQPHSHITGQNRLQTLGAPTRSALDQPQFRAPLDSQLSGRTAPQSMMRCPRRPIGPHPARSMPLFKWIYSPESESSTPSEEALVQGTSHVQCNPLTLPNTIL
ncbi:hypothetical protein M9H77_02584 [Catharanthus roseus]|uniref:Uncharacterized protein n=1 Tax=Catharanthus roseus TaxID=4058 RepID=A0ACC0C943_CATRO|nr:hypothetical protein M9H77_02584 [Catharanthus roseus]